MASIEPKTHLFKTTVTPGTIFIPRNNETVIIEKNASTEGREQGQASLNDESLRNVLGILTRPYAEYFKGFVPDFGTTPEFLLRVKKKIFGREVGKLTWKEADDSDPDFHLEYEYEARYLPNRKEGKKVLPRELLGSRVTLSTQFENRKGLYTVHTPPTVDLRFDLRNPALPVTCTTFYYALIGFSTETSPSPIDYALTKAKGSELETIMNEDWDDNRGIRRSNTKVVVNSGSELSVEVGYWNGISIEGDDRRPSAPNFKFVYNPRTNIFERRNRLANREYVDSFKPEYFMGILRSILSFIPVIDVGILHGRTSAEADWNARMTKWIEEHEYPSGSLHS